MAERKLEFAGRLEIGPNAIQRGSTSDYAAISTAISLKRIADALERMAPNGRLHPNALVEAAFNAGRAFEEGRER